MQKMIPFQSPKV